MKLYKHCVYRKSYIETFGDSQQRTKGTLNLIHVDLWGQSKTLSHCGARYFLICVDDFLRKLWIHILKTKYEVHDTFKNQKAMIENQTVRKVKIFCINNGLELCSDFLVIIARMWEFLSINKFLGHPSKMVRYKGSIEPYLREFDVCSQLDVSQRYFGYKL